MRQPDPHSLRFSDEMCVVNVLEALEDFEAVSSAISSCCHQILTVSASADGMCVVNLLGALEDLI